MNRLDRPPLVLHQQGRAEVLDWIGQGQAVAVVGTRAASDHVLRMAEHLGTALAEAGWPVISSLSEGIDAAAHRGCLAAGGVPVAVLGTPLDGVNPRHHHSLQQDVAENGLLLSERRPGESLQPGHFAARNRLLVCLSSALVVVEYPDRSGALISARLAAENQFPFWVIPGDAGRWSSRGCNRLLQNKAAPLLSPQELVEHLGPGPCHQVKATAEVLMKALGSGTSIEQLQQTLKLPAGRLASDLLPLELAGQVVCESGFLWMPFRP